jgi:hypothetical protein
MGVSHNEDERTSVESPPEREMYKPFGLVTGWLTENNGSWAGGEMRKWWKVET